jgi:RHS repeat-associated protein
MSANSARGVGSSTEAAVSITASYDGFDRLMKTREQKSGASTWQVSTMGYDEDSNLTQTVDNAVEGSTTQTGRENDYTYDGADWLGDQTDHGKDNSSSSDDRHITFAFLPTGWERNRTIQKAGATKESTDRTYFLNGQLKTLTTKNGSGTTMESHDVSYLDNGVYLNGNRVQDTYALRGPAGGPCAASCTAEYTYDALDRLTHEHTDRGDGSNLDIGYTLNPAGDVTQQRTNGSIVNYSYAGQQLRLQLDADNNVVARYFYDAHGSLDCVTTAAGSAASCATAGTPSPDSTLISSYAYDPLDRLLSYHAYPASGTTKGETYTYDALDRPTREAVTRQGAPEDTSTLTYLGLGDQLTNETHSYSGDQTANPPKTRDYSYDPFGNRVGMTYQRAGNPAKDFYYGYDPHGSVSLLLDDAGNAQASYGYTAYGNPDVAITEENSADGSGQSDPNDPVNPYRYTAKRIDPGSGTLDMGARRFTPDPGRYLQEDQLDDALGDLSLSDDPLTADRYGLAGGNPANFVESDGHMPIYDGGITPSAARQIRRSRESALRRWAHQSGPTGGGSSPHPGCMSDASCGGGYGNPGASQPAPKLPMAGFGGRCTNSAADYEYSDPGTFTGECGGGGGVLGKVFSTAEKTLIGDPLHNPLDAVALIPPFKALRGVRIAERLLRVARGAKDVARTARGAEDAAKDASVGEGIARDVVRSFDNPESLRGAAADQARAAVPGGYEGPFPLRKGAGERYFDPERPGNAIYIEEGNPAAQDPLHQGPYVRIARNGSVTRIPLRGNPTLP